MNKQTQDHYIEELRSGIDWLSATLDRETPGADGWYAFALSCVRAVQREGHEGEDRSMLGFRGAKAGGCFAGENERRYYVQLSGEYASRWYEEVDRHEPHYSRIDLQVTVRFYQEQNAIAREAYRQYTAGDKTERQPGRRKAYIIIGSDGGDTCYIGAPSSRQRARIYNKAKQSEAEAYERCWRYEVVLRDELARGWAELYRQNNASLPDHALYSVAQWFETRGVYIPFKGGTDLVVLPKLRTLPTDIERKIAWLNTQVKPTVAYLLELGFESIVREALGLAPSDAGEERQSAT